MNKINQKIIPFFTFKGVAEEAMNYYVSFFKDAKIVEITYFGENQRGEVGKVMNGTFEVMGMTMMVMDMEEVYAPEFTWATTMLLNFDLEEDFDHAFKNLAEGGVVMMGPEAMGELKKVAWITDKYSVTWQMVWY